jgi:hypothetical protein
MGIPNDSVTQNEIEEKRRQEAAEELREEQRRKAEKSLDRALEDSFPASDPPSVTQPPPSVYDKRPKREAFPPIRGIRGGFCGRAAR